MSEELNGPSHSRPWGAQTAEQVRPAPAETGQEDRQTATRPHAATTPSDGESEELIKAWKPSRKRLLLLAMAVVLLLIGAFYGVPYYYYAVSHEWTDNAFVEGHIVQVSPQVAGHVLTVSVTDNQPVKEGELLVEIDPRDYAARLAQARAALQAALARFEAAQTNVELTQVTASADVRQTSAGVELAKSALQTARTRVTAARSQLEQARAQVMTALAQAEQERAQVTAGEAEAMRAEADVKRFQELSRRDQIARQELDHAMAAMRTANAQLQASRKKVAAAEAQVAEARAAQQMAAAGLQQSESQVAEAEARVGEALGRLDAAQAAPHQVAVSRSQAEIAAAELAQARAAVAQAELELSYTTIRAPAAGRVTRKAVEEGAYVQAGRTLMAIVPADVWVVANFKETQLTDMRPGQPAEIEVDAYPGIVFKGHVDSIQAGTGARFSLLPPENATGNFVKVVQRVPVKIVFDAPVAGDHLLVPGMSVVPAVRVKSW
jgi:membrane fusion protein, multidrug efflux system